MIYILLSLAFLLSGVIVGRWLIVVAPAVIWAVYAIGRDAGWWGRKPGEFLVLGTIILVIMGVALAAVGVLVHKRASRWGRT